MIKILEGALGGPMGLVVVGGMSPSHSTATSIPGGKEILSAL
jgi:hypothetical protein